MFRRGLRKPTANEIVICQGEKSWLTDSNVLNLAVEIAKAIKNGKSIAYLAENWEFMDTP